MSMTDYVCEEKKEDVDLPALKGFWTHMMILESMIQSFSYDVTSKRRVMQ